VLSQSCSNWGNLRRTSRNGWRKRIWDFLHWMQSEMIPVPVAVVKNSKHVAPS